MADGRFAPSPTGGLHIGNLRTGLLAWLYARSSGGRFRLRIEDLDPAVSRAEHVAEHLADLAALGLDHDGPVVAQSDPDRRAAHEAALAELDSRGLLYPCYCSRREVAEAAAAAHGPSPEGAYPGTCRGLSPADQAARAGRLGDRSPALRVRTGEPEISFVDRFAGPVSAVVDDFVVRRGDGVKGYNLAVVVDDAAAGIEEVVRGDDLLLGTARHAWLYDVLGLARPAWVHVPLVVGPDGERLAKRHGSVTRRQLAAAGVDASALLGLLAESIGLTDVGGRPGTAGQLLAVFDPGAVPRAPWVFVPPVG